MQIANTLQSDKARVECDSHADASVVGRNCLTTHDFDRPVNVSGCDPKDGTKNHRTVSTAMAYDHPQMGQVHMLVIH